MNDDVRSRLDALERRQSLLRQELAGLDETLAELKGNIPDAAPTVPAQPPLAPPPAPMVPPPLPDAVAEIPSAAAPSVVPVAPVPPPLPQTSVPRESSLEMRVGTVWLARIGIVILLTGLVFLANYAWKSLIENFGAVAKLGLLYLAGGALCAIGLVIERGRESLKSYSRILIAGGLAAIYYTTYAAYFVPSLKVIGSPLVAGILLVAIAAVMGWMAERRNSQSTASLAILLAFYASTVNPLSYFSLCSNAILGIAAVILMARKRWMVVSFLALVATYGSYLSWRIAENWRFWEVHAGGDADLAVRLGFLSLYWIIFTAGVFFPAGTKGAGAARVVFSTLNDAAFFCLAAVAISAAHRDSVWMVALVFGLIQCGLALAARRAHGAGSPLGSAWFAKALFFLTLALLIRFTGSSLAVILIVECSLLVFAAKQLPSRVLSAAGPLAGLAAAFAGLFCLSERGTLWAAGLVAMLLMANAWYSSRRPKISPGALLLALSGMALGVAILVNQFPDQWEGAGIAFLGLVLVAGLTLHKSRELAFAGVLAAGGSLLFQLAVIETAGPWPSFLALALLAAVAVTGSVLGGGDSLLKIPCGILAIAATLLFWVWVNTYIPEGHRFWILALAAILALVLSWGRPLRQAVATILAVAALLIFLSHSVGFNARYSFWDLPACLLLLSGERLARFVRAPVGLARFLGLSGLVTILMWVTATDRFHHDPLPLTAAWALLALALFFAGFLVRARIFRLGGLGILGLALARVILFDVWLLDLPLRILSFLVLGGVLLVLGYFYNRYAERLRQWL